MKIIHPFVLPVLTLLGMLLAACSSVQDRSDSATSRSAARPR